MGTWITGCDMDGHVDNRMRYGCQMDCSRISLIVPKMKMADKLPFRSEGQSGLIK